jgi:hypothetical protein
MLQRLFCALISAQHDPPASQELAAYDRLHGECQAWIKTSIWMILLLFPFWSGARIRIHAEHFNQIGFLFAARL